MMQLFLSELAFDNDLSVGPKRIAVDGKIYDVSAFLHVHPGGDGTIRSLLGRDATTEYNLIHQGDDHKVIFSRMICGTVREPEFTSEADRTDWNELSVALDECIAMVNIFSLETEVLNKNCFRDETEIWNGYKEHLCLEFFVRVRSVYIPHSMKYVFHLLSAELKRKLETFVLPEEKGNEEVCRLYINLTKDLLVENLRCIHTRIRMLEKQVN